MDINATMQAIARQKNVGAFSDGQGAPLRMSRAGHLFTADWKTSLILAGYGFNVTVGDLANGGGASAGVTGGGNGTIIDSDQPELILGVTAGYVLVPLYCQISLNADLDADAEIAEIAFFADATQAPPLSATATAKTPISLIGTGVHSSVARVHSAVTADITDPVASVMLGHKVIRASEAGTAASAQVYGIDLVYDPSTPRFFRGPCSLVVCYGGSAAVTGFVTLDYAEIPEGLIYP